MGRVHVWSHRARKSVSVMTRLGPAGGLTPSGCSNLAGWFGLCMFALSRESLTAVQKLLFMCDLVTHHLCPGQSRMGPGVRTLIRLKLVSTETGGGRARAYPLEHCA